MPGTVTPATSARKQEQNKVITHIIIVELSGRARQPFDLCYRENVVQGENQQRYLEILVTSVNDRVSATISVTE